MAAVKENSFIIHSIQLGIMRFAQTSLIVVEVRNQNVGMLMLAENPVIILEEIIMATTANQHRIIPVI